MKILIVDDYAEMCLLIKAVLAEFADGIRECADGAEALASYRENQADWVIMDLKLRQPDALSVTRQITAAFPSARVIIVSDFDDPRMRQAALSAGAREYVIKEELMQLREILRT